MYSNKLVPINKVVEQLCLINTTHEILQCFQSGLISEQEAMEHFCDRILTWAQFLEMED